MIGEARVVVTGMGAVTPLGLTAEATWKAACEGQSGIATITRFDPKDLPVRFAGEVRGIDFTESFSPLFPHGQTGENPLTQAIHPKDLRRFGRFTQLALVAGVAAYRDSGLDAIRGQISPEDMGINIGVGMGGLPEIEEVHTEFLAKGPRRVSPFFIPQVIPNLASGQLSIILGLEGPNLCNVTACASSAHSIGESFRSIRRGEAKVMIVGGAEAVISPLGIAGFASMRALSTRNDDPARASRPYDKDRDGFVMGEGAVVLVIEEYEHAKKRGAKIYAELKGYGATSDAYHITTPAPEGAGGFRAMSIAMKDAGLNSSELGYVNTHGTSTPAGDAEEAIAVAKLSTATGTPSRKLAVSSTKSMTGHLLGAAGALEAMFCVLALRDQIVPPTINLESLDPACKDLPLDFVTGTARPYKMQSALSNSFGFGGTNASLVLAQHL